MAKKNRRVLVVSADNRLSAEWVAALTAKNRQVSRVETAEQAIDKIAEVLPGLIFLHIPPGLTVASVSPEFDKRCRNYNAPVVTILSTTTPADLSACFHRGAVDVLPATFDARAMDDALERAANFRNLYQENAEYRKQLERANRTLKENLNILRMDQLAGRQVQLNMLPESPFVSGDYEIAHRIVPSLYLSGDFVGYNILFDRYLLFYFADVSGHGASSAFVTVMLGFILRQIMRRHIGDHDVDALSRAPEGLIEHINRQILAMGLDKHLTIFVGSIDMKTDVLRYAVGAQLPMPVLATEGDAKFLAGKGKPVGLFPDAHWTVHEIVLPRVFSLAIVSDGLLDCLSGKTLLDKEQQLLSAVGRAGPSHARVCTELGIDDIRAAPDDVSLVTVARGR